MDRSCWCGTVSNAFWKPKSTTSVCNLWSIAYKISSVTALLKQCRPKYTNTIHTVYYMVLICAETNWLGS